MARNPESLKNLVAGNKRGPAKTTKLLKDAILLAAQRAGDKIGQDGVVSYLEHQAMENPGPFMSLLGKVLPQQTAMTDSDGNDLPAEITFRIVRPDGGA